ncbi:MAG: hypothetical protein IT377_29130 [Polyangiaceae bacterium]|nr:hypothetical protein [Polyangiaceae bacterium]
MVARGLAVLGALGCVLGPSCVSTLGLDDEQRSAAKQLCVCGEVNQLYGGDVARCTEDVERSLERVTEPTRAAWMKKYTSTCTTCPKSADCYFTPPTCALAGPCPDNQCGRCCNQPATGECT